MVIIILILFFFKITSLYLSIKDIRVDDCISNIYIEKLNDKTNISLFKIKDIKECYIDKTRYYPDSYPYIVKNHIYELGDIVYIVSYNVWNIGFINIIIQLDEFILKTCQQNILKCNNCIQELNQYVCKNDEFISSYLNTGYYYYFFQLNSIYELNKSEINSTFYTLAQKIDSFSLYYQEDELEIINFYNPDNFYIIENKSLAVNYSYYYFKIDSINQFNGTLKGLNLSNSEITLKNNDSFKVTESRGLIYRLSSQEKKNGSVYIKFNITVYNFPNSIHYSNAVTISKEFHFNISLTGENLKCLNHYNYYYNGVYNHSCDNLSKELIFDNIPELMYKLKMDEIHKLISNNLTISIGSINSTFFEPPENVNFTQCEGILKTNYNISSSSVIILFKIESNNTNSSTNDIEYYTYDDNENRLNFSLCIEKKKFIINSSLCYKELYFSYLEEDNKIYACLDKSKEELIINISEIIEIVEIGKNYEIKGNDYYLKINPTNATYLSSVTHVNFTKCEEILRKKYNISSSRYITFLQLEINNTNEKSLINKVEYQAYDHNKKALNLSFCDDVRISYSIKSSSLFDLLSANSFKDLGIDIFNIKDSFFTDVCHSYSNSKNDLTLKDRIRDIFQNFSLCEEDCSYENVDLKNMIVTCNCEVKNNLSISEIKENFFQYKDKSSNFQIIKCYNLVFSLKGKKFNIGFWIFLFLVSAHIPLLFIYFYYGIKPIKDYIFKEMIKFGYIKNKKSKNNESVTKKFVDDTKNNKIINKIHKQTINKSNKKININKKETKNMKNNILAKSSKIKKSKKIKNNKINILTTKGKEKNNKSKKIVKKNGNNIYNFNIININLNDKKRVYEPKDSKIILNNYTFKEAIKYDYRSICLIYYIILLSKQPIFHAFLFKSPLESFPLRLCVFIFIYSSDLALNALFYLDDKISEKYQYAKSLFLFAFSNNLTVIFLSTFVGFLFMTLFTNLSNSYNDIRNIFRNEETKLIKNKKYNVSDKRKKEIQNEIDKILNKFRIKMIILIIIEFSLMLFFWYYVTAFCHVYNSTQYSWLFDSLLSILSRSFIDFLLPLGLAKLYRLTVEANVQCLYKIILFFYCFA